MIIAYIAHPIGGDVEGNVKALLEIIKQVNLNHPDVVPFAPYLADVMAMDDSDPVQRARGIRNDKEILSRGIVDELWLFGDRISPGMRDEMKIAAANRIPVLPMTVETHDQLYSDIKGS